MRALPNALILDRPIRIVTLSSALQMACRIRYRQRQVRDLLEARRRAEDAVRESEEQFRALVNASADVLYRMSPDWTEMRVLNGRGFLADTAEASRNWLERYIMPEDQPRVKAAIEEAIRTKGIFQLEHPVRKADGTTGSVESRAVPLLDAKGQIVEWFGAASDITDRKRAEEELRRAAEDLARSNRDLEQFAYGASHDLQEPLRVVRNFVDLMHRKMADELPSAAAEYMNFITEGVTRMQELIKGLLEYSRVGRAAQDKCADAEQVLGQTIKNMRVLIEDEHVELVCGPLPQVCIDPVQLGQLFQNLIGNAIKFRKPDERPRVEVSARSPVGSGLAHSGMASRRARTSEDSHWLFAVRDNGIGIEPEFKDRVFLIFQRLHTRQEYPGTGIGLAVCKKIVERHGGRIWVESEPGKGSVFYFTLRAG
jgi:signal transduction histidine kinase